jgi:hypothetical protein
VKSFKTPTLVVTASATTGCRSSRGSRCSRRCGGRAFPRGSALPDEGHWVLKPQNSVRWYAEVVSWLDRWTKP